VIVKLKVLKHWPFLLAVSLFSFAFVADATSRVWKQTPVVIARDYAQIVDQRSPNEFVMLWWLVPEQIPEQQIVFRDVLSGAVHARADAAGTVSFDDASSVQVTDDKGQQLALLSNEAVPPTITGALATLQAALSQSAGPLGRGIRWFVYKGGSVHSCEKGRMSVELAGETYTYDTPIPGCPKT
jgi:hypothetical protein